MAQHDTTGNGLGKLPSRLPRYAGLRQLQGAASPACASEEVGHYAGQTSRRTFHIFINRTPNAVDVSCEGELQGSVEPGANLYVGKLSVGV
jgi:hypothetical protein